MTFKYLLWALVSSKSFVKHYWCWKCAPIFLHFADFEEWRCSCLITTSYSVGKSTKMSHLNFHAKNLILIVANVNLEVNEVCISLRLKCCIMRLFQWFSNTVRIILQYVRCKQIQVVDVISVYLPMSNLFMLPSSLVSRSLDSLEILIRRNDVQSQSIDHESGLEIRVVAKK